MQLFQRRRWIHPDRVDAGLDAFVHQLAWIDVHTGLAMAGWRRIDPGGGSGEVLASTIYDDHSWFLAEKTRLQTLVDYAPVNETAAVLMVGEDAFERWDSPVDTPDGWSPGEDRFRQNTGPLDLVVGNPAWSNAEGADGLVSWFPADDQTPVTGPTPGDGCRIEEWSRIH
ncbi:MAG: hypothetical protein VX808_06330 [Actinomycetota bacterium]|nr:hypothetical protein [Actinomycetota bacterium]